MFGGFAVVKGEKRHFDLKLQCRVWSKKIKTNKNLIIESDDDVPEMLGVTLTILVIEIHS